MRNYAHLNSTEADDASRSPMHWTTSKEVADDDAGGGGVRIDLGNEDWPSIVPVSVLDHFEANALKSPAAAALVLEDGRSYSYRVLNDLANAVGEKVAVACRGAADETPLIGVMVTRGVALVVGILGCLKAGAAYVPVDPAFPPDRQTYIFDQAQCHCLLTDAACLDQAVALGVKVPPTLVLDAAAMTVHGRHGSVVARAVGVPPIGPDVDEQAVLRVARAKVAAREHGGLMYVLYTSGSTGKPKGVMIKQAGVTSQILWFRDELHAGPHTRVLGLATVCFDISVLEMYLPLVCGGTLVYADQGTQKDPFALRDLIERQGVTVLQATPTTYDMLHAIGWAGSRHVDCLVGGEAFRPSLSVFAANCRSLRNIYGPTETTMWASSFLVPKEVSALAVHNGSPVVPVGLPIANYVFMVVDTDSVERGRPRLAADGAEGELWIGALGMGLGYLRRPDLTDRAYVKNPFGRGTVYRTGDLVRRLDGGRGPYHFIRRIDNQVKVDGFRIELSEIEYVFASHPLVHQCVALLKKQGLTLYLKPAQPAAPPQHLLSQTQLAEVRAHAARSLTHYMMPKVLAQVGGFQLTPSGKIDRNAVPDPEALDPACVDWTGGVVAAAAAAGVEGLGRDVRRADDVHLADLSDHRTKPAPAPVPPPGVGSSGSRGTASTGASGLSRVGVGRGRGAGRRALARHILDIAEEVRGRRPPAQASFAAIGVDSLGAVLFVKRLSDSLGGLRIRPAQLYAPGVTIESFADELFVKMAAECPHALSALGIPADDDEQGAWLGGSGAGDERSGGEAGEEHYGQALGLELENAFADMVNANRGALESLRGVFTFMVLYDHFHNPTEYISDVFQGDIYLFVVFSGIATAIALREPPRFVVPSPAAPIEAAAAAVAASTATAAEELARLKCSGKEGPASARYLQLQPRTPFNLRLFMQSRLLGLYPILWIALLLNGPVWWQQTLDPGRGSPAVKGVCSVLYVVGMQSWWRPQCGHYGPNNILYASLIINVFLIYGVARRCVIEPVQAYVARWASPLVDPLTLQPPPETLATRGWGQWLGDTAVALSYNRVGAAGLVPVLLMWLAGTWGLGHLMLYFTFAKNAPVFVPYFLMGVFFVACLESVHFALWDFGRRTTARAAAAAAAAGAVEDEEREDGAGAGAGVGAAALGYVYRVLHCSDDLAATFPWAHASPWLARLYVSEPPLEATRYVLSEPRPIGGAAEADVEMGRRRRVDSAVAEDGALVADDRQRAGAPPPPHAAGGGSAGVGANGGVARERVSTAVAVGHYVWRFAPDLLSLTVGLVMSPLVQGAFIQGWLLFVGVPTLFLALVFVLMLQKGSARLNLSRWVLQWRPLATMGYASYGVYLFQRIVFTFYFPLIYIGSRLGHYGMDIGNGDPWIGGPWFEQLHNGFKFLSAVFIVLMAWLAHKYVQDMFVPWLIGVLCKCSARR